MFQTQEAFDAYLAEIAEIEVPDLCERVLFKWAGDKEFSGYRVTGWYRAESDVKPEIKSWSDQLFWDLHEDSRAERLERGDVRVRPCAKREDATHVGITGIAGAIVRIDRIERTGKLVEWHETLIQQHKDDWASKHDPEKVNKEGAVFFHFNAPLTVSAR